MKLKYVLMFPNDSQTYYDLSIMIGIQDRYLQQEDRSQQILLACLFLLLTTAAKTAQNG
jgi:hypothetical protein